MEIQSQGSEPNTFAEILEYVESQIEMANTNGEKFAEFRSQVLEECKEIQDRIHIIRQKVQAQIGGDENLTGFLTGSIGDYLDEFDAQIAKMNLQFDKDARYWSD